MRIQDDYLANRRTSRTLPGKDEQDQFITETWTYDDYGRTDVHRDFNGQETQYIYEADGKYGGRLLQERRFTAEVTTATPNETTEHLYDGLGRSQSVKEYVGTSLSRTTTYSYDSITGNISQIVSLEGTISHGHRW